MSSQFLAVFFSAICDQFLAYRHDEQLLLFVRRNARTFHANLFARQKRNQCRAEYESVLLP